MDWYEWLRRAGLGDDLAAKYALLFARNQLGAADVRHLDHAFLATMGVAVAKHRLEILKLARKDSSAITVLPWRATRLLAAAAQRSARSLAGCLRSAARRGRCASAVAPRPLALCHQGVAGPARWKSAPTTGPGSGGTARKLAALLTRVGKPVHTLTNRAGKGAAKNGAIASPTTYMATAIAAGCFASTETCGSDYDADDDEDDDAGTDDDDPETPWESMFEDLNPT